MGLGESAHAFDAAGTQQVRSGKTKPVPERLVPVKDIRKRILLIKTMQGNEDDLFSGVQTACSLFNFFTVTISDVMMLLVFFWRSVEIIHSVD